MYTNNLYGNAVNPSSNVTAVSTAIDWDGLEEWLGRKGYAEKYKAELLRCARKYVGDFFSGNVVEMEKAGGNGLAAGAALAKFCGLYKVWKERLEQHGIKWRSTSVEDSFFRMFESGGTVAVEDWMTKVREKVDKDEWLTCIYLGLTGQRTGEGLYSLRRIANVGIERYPWNDERSCLEHFRDRWFLRKTKKSYISICGDLLKERLETWKKQVTYGQLRSSLRRKGVGVRLYDLRSWNGTILRQGGLEREFVDMLHGRIAPTTFARFYYKPTMEKMIGKVKKVLRAFEENWLS